jgi:hypothetical protein
MVFFRLALMIVVCAFTLTTAKRHTWLSEYLGLLTYDPRTHFFVSLDFLFTIRIVGCLSLAVAFCSKKIKLDKNILGVCRAKVRARSLGLDFGIGPWS